MEVDLEIEILILMAEFFDLKCDNIDKNKKFLEMIFQANKGK